MRRAGDIQRLVVPMAMNLLKGETILVAGCKDPSNYIKRLAALDVPVQAIPHYKTFSEIKLIVDGIEQETKTPEPELQGYLFKLKGTK